MVGFELSLVREDRLKSRQRMSLKMTISVGTGWSSGCWEFCDLKSSSLHY